MGKPRFLVENLFSERQFTGHTISANEADTDHQAFRVADERRGPLSYWTPTTNNQDAWLKVDAGSGSHPKADLIVLDRGHNLGGETLTLEISADDSTWSQLFQVTVPSSESTDGDVTASNGARTEEGAWVKDLSSDNLLGPDAGPEQTDTDSYLYLDKEPISNLGLEVGDVISASMDLHGDGGGTSSGQILIGYWDSGGTQIGSFTQSGETTDGSTTYEREQIENETIPTGTASITVRSDNANNDGSTISSRRAMLNRGSTALAFEQPNRARYWRLTVSAMGAGLKPKIRGLWLGDSYRPSFLFDLPFTWGKRQLQYDSTTSDAGWRGMTNRIEARTATYRVKTESASEYDTARYHIEDLYAQGHAMWVVVDQAKAERSWLSSPPAGEIGFEQASGWGFQQAEVPCREHQPERP